MSSPRRCQMIQRPPLRRMRRRGDPWRRERWRVADGVAWRWRACWGFWWWCGWERGDGWRGYGRRRQGDRRREWRRVGDVTEGIALCSRRRGRWERRQSERCPACGLPHRPMTRVVLVVGAGEVCGVKGVDDGNGRVRHHAPQPRRDRDAGGRRARSRPVLKKRRENEWAIRTERART